jgi:hypothetical protein
MIQPIPHRPGELGVHSLDHFNLLVPDVADAAKFLRHVQRGNALSLFPRLAKLGGRATD